MLTLILIHTITAGKLNKKLQHFIVLTFLMFIEQYVILPCPCAVYKTTQELQDGS